MKRKMMAKMFVVYLIFTFCASLFMPYTALAAQSATTNASTWVVDSPKGTSVTTGAAGYETWSDGKQYWVVRDTKGHFVTWGKVATETWSDGRVREVVRDSNGLFKTWKFADNSSVANTNTTTANATTNTTTTTTNAPTT
ncbi:MAG TPA: hypothetical protein PKK26_04955, partial [Candidatus Wallbacteria bacterium]|nr:hypothetical protein [Candidatus Wallbacteria bacterium]